MRMAGVMSTRYKVLIKSEKRIKNNGRSGLSHRLKDKEGGKSGRAEEAGTGLNQLRKVRREKLADLQQMEKTRFRLQNLIRHIIHWK